MKKFLVEYTVVAPYTDWTSDKPTNLCSDYCKEEHKKTQQCKADIRRGYKRD